jgi:hypothetical protein
MNKRIILFAAAVLAFSTVLTACDDKEKPGPRPQDTVINEDTGDTPIGGDTEREYIECSEDDFKTIKVTLTYPDKEPPVEVSSIDISGLDFGKKLPVCNTEENAKNYYENMFSLSQIEYNWEKLINEEAEGIASNCCMYDGKCYIVVEYKSFLSSDFDFSLFCYDEKSSRNEEVYSWSSKDINESYKGTPVLSNGKMFYSVYNVNDNSSKVYAYDLISGDIKSVYENNSPIMCHDDKGYPSIVVYDIKDSVTETLHYEADSERFISDKNEDLSGKVYTNNIFNGVPYYLVKPHDKRKLDMICQYYHVSLSYTGGTIIYADDKKFLIKNEGSIHMYDLEKMEHYILDVTGMGSECTYCNGMVFTGNWYEKYKMPVYCIIPELGIAYVITDNDLYCGLKTVGDKVTFNSIDSYVEDIRDENGKGVSHELDKVKKVYIVVSR